MKKKVLAILLAALMVMTLLPTVAFAEGPVDYTLTLDGAQAVYCVNSGDETGRDAIAEVWTQFSPTFLTNVMWEAFSVNTWSAFYATYEAGSVSQGGKFSGSNGSFSISAPAGQAHWLLLALTDATALTPGAAYTAYYATSSVEGGEITVDTTPIATGNLCTDAPAAPSGNANVKGTITAADFGYELIIPAETTLTEDDHTDVLLGGDGKVSIEVTKHSADNVDVSYTVDLANGNLTDGTTTIAATYKVKQGEAAFATIVDDGEANATKVTVYTGGSIVDSYVNVTADSEQWDAAPVGDYNATLVFNFKDEEVVTVADLLPNDFPTAKIGSTWKKSGGSAALFVNVNNAQLYAEDGFTQSIELNTKLTPAGEGVYTCTGNQNETWTFTVENGKFTQVVIAGLTSMQAELNGTYSKAE